MKIVIVIIFIIFIPFAANAEQSYSEYMKSANKHLENAKYNVALDLLHHAEALANTEKEKVAVGNAIGWAYYNADNNNEARKYFFSAFHKAVDASDPKLAQKVSNNIGLLEYSDGNFKDAKAYFSNKWSKNSETSIRYLSIIKKLENLEKVKGIIAMGVTYRLNLDFKSAVAEYNKALNIIPNDARVLEYKGYALYRLGDNNRAIKVLEKARKIKPRKLNIIINLLKAYCVSGSVNAANMIIEQNSELLTKSQCYHQLKLVA